MQDNRIRQFKRQLQESRFRLYHMYRDPAKLLYNLIFVATDDVWRISTNGSCIYFNPAWLKSLGKTELDFILSHELMHIVLGHTERPPYYYGERYHLAADIVANGKLGAYGWSYNKIPHIGRIRYETYLPAVNGALIESVEAMRYVPIDPSTLDASKRRLYLIDSDEWWDRKKDRGENGTIVLSPLDTDPDDLEYDGPAYDDEFVYKKEKFPLPESEEDSEEEAEEDEKRASKHNTDTDSLRETIRMLRQKTQQRGVGSEEGSDERLWRAGSTTELDWKSLLNHFIQEEINDYSFTPPDRRIQDCDFFLPDYNAYQESVREVCFMVDTSGSISDDILFMAYSEIKQALEQFNGKLRGILAFFDTKVRAAARFCDVSDIESIKPAGGGGTDYHCVFDFINSRNDMKLPTGIVIVTDGEGEFPNSVIANNIPVLWLMTGSRSAPWGTSVRIKRQLY